MSKRRSGRSIGEIAKYVAMGHSQSPSNCRVLLDEIERLHTKVHKLEGQVLNLIGEDIDTANFVPIPRELYERWVELTKNTIIDRENDMIDGDVGL